MACWSHIINLWNIECSRTLKLSPKISKNHIYPVDLNNIFDLLNKTNVTTHKLSNVVTKFKEEAEWVSQWTLINNTTRVHKSLMKCINGLIFTLRSFNKFIPTTKLEINNYIWLRNINQDALDNNFGLIRARGSKEIHPTPYHFIYRLKASALALCHTEGNCEIDKSFTALECLYSANLIAEVEDYDLCIEEEPLYNNCEKMRIQEM